MNEHQCKIYSIGLTTIGLVCVFLTNLIKSKPIFPNIEDSLSVIVFVGVYFVFKDILMIIVDLDKSGLK